MSKMTQKRLPSDGSKGDTPLPKRPRTKSFSKTESDDTFLERLWRTRRNSEGLVRLGSKPANRDLQLVALVTHSQYVRRCVESIGGEGEDSKGEPLVIDLPDCPGDLDVFKIVGEFCLGVMDDKDISFSNVVKLITTSAFLEMESLTSRALTFLEESVFNSWENCLSMLATFNDNDISFGEGTLFDKCEKAFLQKIQVDTSSSVKSYTGYYSLQCLLQMAQLLPPNVAKCIYQSCRREKLGLCYVISPPHNVSVFFHSSMLYELEGASTLRLMPWKYHVWGRWMEGLSYALPDWSRRSVLMLHLAKSMHMENDVNLIAPKVSSSVYLWHFFCAVLVAVVDLRAITPLRLSPTQNFISVTDVDAEIANLQKLVCYGLVVDKSWIGESSPFELGQSDFFLLTIKKFKFETLLSIVKQLRDLRSNDRHIVSIAKVLDACLVQHLKEKTFTVQQALLIYREFPNKSRPSHGDIYCVFEDFLRRKVLSPKEVRDLTKLLDYQKLSDDIVEKLIKDLQYECDPRLWERFMEKQRERQIDQEKSKEELTKLHKEHNLQTADLVKVRRELTTATQEIGLVESTLEDVKRNLLEEQEKTKELCKAAEEKRLAESKLKDVRRDKRLAESKKRLAESELKDVRFDLEEEKEKTTCQICFSRPRNALSLPCMHFLYCFDCLHLHHQKSKTCPTCRGPTTGLLKCLLSI